MTATDIGSQIFVFGSNLAGRHGKGAALDARKHYGAIYGQGEGLQGRSYAIPTKGISPGYKQPMPVLPLHQIEWHVIRFIAFARSRPDLLFNVTRIGCGEAGYKDEQIGPMFFDAPSNCILPSEWQRMRFFGQAA